MKKLTKKIVALALAVTTIASGIAISPAQKADAAAKSYNCYLMFASSDWKCVNMKENVANTSIKNKKGKQKVTVTLTRAKAQGDGSAKATAAKDATVFCVDIKEILKDHKVKNLKISGVTVKCDGKKVKIKQSKLIQGQLEPKENEDPNKYRLEIYNVYGKGTKSDPPAKATAFKWSKSISVSFTLNIKK